MGVKQEKEKEWLRGASAERIRALRAEGGSSGRRAMAERLAEAERRTDEAMEAALRRIDGDIIAIRELAGGAADGMMAAAWSWGGCSEFRFRLAEPEEEWGTGTCITYDCGDGRGHTRLYTLELFDQGMWECAGDEGRQAACDLIELWPSFREAILQRAGDLIESGQEKEAGALRLKLEREEARLAQLGGGASPEPGAAAPDAGGEGIRLLCYTLYQMDWMRRISAERQMDALKDWYGETAPEDRERFAYRDWVLENGYGGELYACLDEFLGAEYRDRGYIRGLLGNDGLYGQYLADLEQVR